MEAWPFLFYSAIVIALIVTMLVLSHLLGERHRGQAKSLPYEGGLESSGSARVRLSARFYLVAVFFVVFDLEAVFIVGWALAARELGWQGYASVCVFVGVLGLTLLYIWQSGGLDWSWSSASSASYRISTRGAPRDTTPS